MTIKPEGQPALARRWWPVMMWAAIVIFFSLDWGSGNKTCHLLRPFLQWLNPKISMAEVFLVNAIVRKIAHLTEFGILAGLIFRAYGPGYSPARRIGGTLVIAALIGAISEVIQLFVHSRKSSVWDVLLDVGGALLGLGLIGLIGSLRRKRA